MRARCALGVATAMVTTLALCGCASQDRAGGAAGGSVRTLSFAQPNLDPDPQLRSFADRVNADSHGTLQIDFRNEYHKGTALYERTTVADIAAGRVDMGWVGARVFDQLGVRAFQPLLAPLLVNSYDLEGLVFQAGIPDQMLGEVEQLGVVGIGVLPGPLRRLLSKGEPLTSPEAVKGLHVGIQDSGVAEATFKAFGATTTSLPSGTDIAAVDAIEQQLVTIASNSYPERGATSVVANLNLWPRPLVLLAAPGVWQGLSHEQQGILTGAAHAVVPAALDAARRGDADAASHLCKTALTFPRATPEELQAYHDSVAPVRAGISAAGSQEKAWLEQIDRLTATLGDAPDTVSCPKQGPEGATHTPRAFDNTVYTSYRTGTEPCLNGDPAGVLEVHYASGVATLFINANTAARDVGQRALFTVYRDTLAFVDESGRTTSSMRWRLDGDTLTLSDFEGGGNCGDRSVWTAAPWTLVVKTGKAS